MSTPMRFVACTEESCPMNDTRQCRAQWISFDEHGFCLVRMEGLTGKKSPTERHVEITECRCQKCNHWELDETACANIGSCGLGADLVVIQHKNQPLGPKCSIFDRQISEPPYSAKL
jgi:23S rRNA G2445 N2-methylase RlmL